MKCAFITDLHANREAVEAVFDHARNQGVERWVLLGDFVGYGADPTWVVDQVRDMVREGAIAVLGNHDYYARDGGKQARTFLKLAGFLDLTNKNVRRAGMRFVGIDDVREPIGVRVEQCLLDRLAAIEEERHSLGTPVATTSDSQQVRDDVTAVVTMLAPPSEHRVGDGDEFISVVGAMADRHVLGIDLGWLDRQLAID